jgi:tetratricopeptide (TPR) repeat protein
MVWPAKMAFFYPWREVISPGQVIFSVSLIAVMTAFVLWRARRWPYLPVGWLWYILTLAPVIGIVQVGYQAMADRYAYVPLIGIFIMAAWGIPDLISRFSRHYGIFVFLSAGVIAALVVLSCFHVSHWQNSEKVFRHALHVTRDNHMAQNGMGYLYLTRGDHKRAAVHLQEALRIRPDYADARNNLGIVYMKQGLFEEAISQFHKAREISPGDVRGLNNLGVALACRGQHEEAVSRFREALRIAPDYRKAKDNLAKADGELERSVRRQGCSSQAHLPLDKRR